MISEVIFKATKVAIQGKYLAYFIIVLLLLFTFSCQKEKSVASNVLTVKVGVIEALTGSAAAYGEAITNGIKLAAAECNKNGNIVLELIIEDSAGKQEQALALVKKLINSDQVSVIIGPTLSTEMKVAGPEANISNVSILGTSNTAKGITEIGKYVFRNSMPETKAIPAAMDKAVQKYAIKRVAILYGDDDVFTKSGYDTMSEVTGQLGLEVVTVERFQKGQSDFQAQLTKIQSLKPDAVLCSALYNEGALILDQARKLGITVPFIGGNGFNSPRLIDVAGKAADGLIVATPWFPDRDDQRVRDFISAYESSFHKKPDQFSAQAYDGVYLVTEAIKKAKSADRDMIRDALAGIKNYQGVLGNFSFDLNRDVDMSPYVLIVREGKFVPLN